MAGARTSTPPQRTCVACRRTGDKRGLIRLVRRDSGAAVDETGRARGRGAYLCSDPACWTRALQRGLLGRALRLGGPLPAPDRAAMEAFAAALPRARELQDDQHTEGKGEQQ